MLLISLLFLQLIALTLAIFALLTINCYIFQRFLLNDTQEILAANTESGEQEEETIAQEEPGEGRSPKRKKIQ